MCNTDCPSCVDRYLALTVTSARTIPLFGLEEIGTAAQDALPGLPLESVPVPQRSPCATPALAAPTFLFHANIFPSYSESCLSFNRVHFPTSVVVLQIMGYKELMAEYKSI